MPKDLSTIFQIIQKTLQQSKLPFLEGEIGKILNHKEFKEVWRLNKNKFPILQGFLIVQLSYKKQINKELEVFLQKQKKNVNTEHKKEMTSYHLNIKINNFGELFKLENRRENCILRNSFN